MGDRESIPVEMLVLYRQPIALPAGVAARSVQPPAELETQRNGLPDPSIPSNEMRIPSAMRWIESFFGLWVKGRVVAGNKWQCKG